MITLKRCQLDVVPTARHWMLTIGIPSRMALRVTRGKLGSKGRFYNWLPDIFIIKNGRRA